MLKSKEQALAMADALMAPANAARRRKVEGRLQLLYGNSLAAIPEANRPEVQEHARLYAARRWYVYLPSAAAVAWILIAWLWPGVLGAGRGDAAIGGVPAVAIAVTVMLQRRVIHSCIRREAAKYRPADRGDEITPNV